MARKGQRQKKARAPKKCNRVGVSTTATTHTTTTQAPKNPRTTYDKELRQLMGLRAAKT